MQVMFTDFDAAFGVIIGVRITYICPGFYHICIYMSTG